VLPPYSYLALLQAEGRNQEKVSNFLTNIHDKIKAKAHDTVKIFGPVPTAMERKAGYFRMQLLFQSKNRSKLQQALDKLLEIVDKSKPDHGIRWFLDVDPMEI